MRIFLYFIYYKINKLLRISILFRVSYAMFICIFRFLFYIIKIDY
nr:MAG TPA: hypothetical protein [Caudoviricetes sp.]